VIAFVVLAWLIGSGRWNFFGIWTLDSTTGWSTGFGDLAFLTGVADCFATESANVAIDLDTCDPYGRPYSPYGLIPGKILAFFQLGLADTAYLGIGLMLIWVFLVYWLTYLVLRNWTGGYRGLIAALVLVTLFSISPSAMLAVERGTIDILVATFAAIGLITLGAQIPRIFHWFAGAFLFLAVALKYFPIGVFAPFFAPRRWSVAATVGAGASVAFLVLNLDNLRAAQSIAMADSLSTTRIMFSSTTGLVTLLVADPLAFAPPADQVLSSTALQIIGISLFAVLTLLFVSIMRLTAALRDLPNQSWYLVVGGSFTITIPYFLGASNDYRLVLLLLPLAGLLIWIGSGVTRAMAITLWVVSTATVFAALTGSAMLTNEYGFIVPKIVIVAGDAALATTLAFGVALFVSAWLPSRRWTAMNDSVGS